MTQCHSKTDGLSDVFVMYVHCLLSLLLDIMGRGFIVEDAVEGYLSKLCEKPTSPVTGLLIGQVQYKCNFHRLFAVTHERNIKLL